ncbi:MAG TPA: selenocysteine-specific translation elongation factor [Solirubrobacteraceae bacterium]|nr:selenocysteine-specific translation elongation factor [Solirubrobacteraceae bacterium]
MSAQCGPLTLGTAGHVDHGKTTLVAAITGVDTDRLPEERSRGLTIVLGYAPLVLPGGRMLSLVDVPGHERFVRTMVAGATGVDAYLMAIAADDGVMPQTIEHTEVLRALGVEAGVVAVTKADIGDPERTAREAAELLPGAPIVTCSARTGAGIPELAEKLEQVAASIPGRAHRTAQPRLHIDRVFSVLGRGTVVTGTLWSGAIERGDELELAPSGTRTRVRSVQVHDRVVERAAAGQRVAVNLTGVKVTQVARGDVLGAGNAEHATRVLDCCLSLRSARHGQRVQVLHGTRAVAGRLAALDRDLWQLRLEAPLLARDGDRLVVRRLSPPDTLGGGVVLDARARRHGARPELLERLRSLRAGAPQPDLLPASAGATAQHPGAPLRAIPLERRDLEVLERRVKEAGVGLLSEAQLQSPEGGLAALRGDGRLIRVSGRLYAHVDVLVRVRGEIVAMLERDGAVTLAEVRDELGVSRKSAQAFLEHFDGAMVTRRLADDRRVLGPRAGSQREDAR